MRAASPDRCRISGQLRRLMVVEGHDIVVAGLRSALLDAATPSDGCQLVCVKSLNAALEALDLTFDLVLLDVSTAEGVVSADPLLGLKMLRYQLPDMPVALFSEDESPALMRNALAAGAAGFIPKRTDTATIVAVLEFILKGGVYLPPQALMVSDPQPVALAQPSCRTFAGRAFTPRQQSVLDLLLEGHSNKEIARVLGLTLGTIKNYVSELLKTTNTRTRSQVLAMVRVQPQMLGGETSGTHQVHANPESPSRSSAPGPLAVPAGAAVC
jgi:DNA-binding NarL/FixJ family response regulator